MLFSILALFFSIKNNKCNEFALYQELSSSNNISLYSPRNKDFLSGFDLRPIRNNEPPLEILIDLYEKNKRLLKLCNQNYSLLEREQWAREYLQENETMAANLLQAGLLDDWNFEM